MLKNKYKIVFFGSAEFSVPILQELIRNQAADVVVSVPPKPTGRKQIMTPTSVSKIARENNLPLFEPEDLNDRSFLNQIKKMRPDLFLVAAYGKILPKILLEIPAAGAINIHGSLLPKYRGASPLQAALLNGDKETGITFILMDEKVDHGPILARKKIKIATNCAYSELLRKMSFVSAKITLSVISDFLNKKIKPLPQNDNDASYVKTIKKEDGHIDINMPAKKIIQQINAFEKWPGSYVFWRKNEHEMTLKIIKARCVSDANEKPTGAILKYRDGIALQTGSGMITLEEIQLEGQRPTPALDFCNGHPDIIGAQLY